MAQTNYKIQTQNLKEIQNSVLIFYMIGLPGIRVMEIWVFLTILEQFTLFETFAYKSSVFINRIVTIGRVVYSLMNTSR